jgi:hypothetical protein
MHINTNSVINGVKEVMHSKISIVILLIYIVMLLNTNSAVDYVKEVMHGRISASETIGTPLDQYNHNDFLWINPKVDVSITRLFVLHNFFDGYIWVMYKFETIENGREELPGTGYIMSRWKIHRENGKWEIIEINEAS